MLPADASVPVKRPAVTITPPQQDKPFQKALNDAKTATTKAENTRRKADIADADKKWAVVQGMVQLDYLMASISDDPKKEIQKLDNEYRVDFRGNGQSTRIYDEIVAGSTQTAQNLSPQDREFQRKLYDSQQKVLDAEGAMKGASEKDTPGAQANYTTAVTDYLNVLIDSELSDMKPGGPGGNYTAAQWKEAGDNVKLTLGVDGDQAKLIDLLTQGRGKIDAMLDTIKNDPVSLSLTPKEQELAKNDPVTLAVLRLSGVTTTYDKLSAPEKEIYDADPVLWGFMQKADVHISEGTDALPVIEVNDQQLKLDDKTRQVLQLAYQEGGAAGVASMLKQLGLVKSDNTLDSLLPATAPARMEFTTAEVARLMKEGKDTEALKVLGVNMGATQSKAERDAIRVQAGDPHFGKGTDYWNKQIDKQLALPNDDNPFTMADNDADKVGRWMQDVAKNAPPELAAEMLQTVMNRFEPDWLKGNGARAPISTDGTDFYKGLSLSADVADQLGGSNWAGDVAKWLASQPVGENNLIGIMLTENGGPISDTIKGGFGSRLSDALMEELKNAKPQEDGRSYKHASNLLGRAVEDGKKEEGAPIAQAKYDAFMQNKDKILQSFFDQFLDEKNIGKQVKVADTPEARNLIGTVLDLPTNANEAQHAKRDDSVDWYGENTDQRAIIDIAMIWLLDQAKTEDGRTDGATFAAAPFVHVSPHVAIQTGAFLQVTRGDGTKELVDGSVAEDVYRENGKGVNPLIVMHDWHFDDIDHFQDKNTRYDPDGKIFLPRNMQLADSDHDGHVEAADWVEIEAARTTFWEHVQTKGMAATSIIGTGLMFTPFAGVGLGILVVSGVAGVALSGYELYKMPDTGQSRGLSNPNARLHYTNMIGSIAGMGRLGILRMAGTSGKIFGFTVPYAAKIGAWAQAGVKGVKPLTNTLGFIATFTGLNMVLAQGQYLAASAASGQWGIDQWLATGALAAGGGQMIMGGMGFGRPSPTAPIVGSPRQTGIAAFALWRRGTQTGVASTVWTGAWSKFRGNVLEPAYQQWKAASSQNKAGDQYWVTAVDDLKPQIDAEFTTLQTTNPAATRGQAQDNLAGDIAFRAHQLWEEGGRRRNGSSNIFWSKTGRSGAKDFYKTIGVKAATYWQAEQTFLKTVGEEAHGNWVKAGRPTDPYFDAAVAARAAEIKTLTGKTSPTQKELLAAEEKIAQQIGQDAFIAWQRDMKGITAAQWAKGEQEVLGQPAYVNWARAGRPTDRYFDRAIADLQPQILEFAQKKFGTTTPTPAQIRKAQDEMAGQVGARAYQHWADDGRPATATTASFWLNAEKEFAIPAYRIWQMSGEVRYRGNAVRPADQNWEQAVSATPRGTRPESDFAAEIGFKAYESWRSQGRPGETTAQHWLMAEKRFRLAVGEEVYRPWVANGRPLGGDDTYFANTPENFHQKVGKWAYDYWFNNRQKHSAVTEVHWRTAETTRDTAVGKAAFDEWDAGGRPNATWWYDTMNNNPNLKAGITSESQRLAGRDPATRAQNPVTPTHLAAAEKSMAKEIGQEAYRLWVEAGRPRGPATPAAWVKAEADFNTAIGLGAFNVWDAAGRPTDKANKIWRAAPYMARDRGPAADQILFPAQQKGTTWAQRRADPATTLRVRKDEYWQQAKGYLKWLGAGWVAVNVAGGVAEAIYHFGLNEKRTSGNITDPNEELKKYTANPDGYLRDNYTNEALGGPDALVGWDNGDTAYNFKGHLFAFTEDDGTVTYFRRLPEDLYNALKDNKNPQGYTVKGDTITFTETIKLDDVGDFAIADGDPMGEEVDDSIRRRIGFDAYLNWAASGMPTVPGSGFWTQSRQEFRDKAGKPAYDEWVASSRPISGADAVWAVARQDYQGVIDKRANEIWQQSGGKGSGPTQTQIEEAEAESGADIGTRAHQLWAGRNKTNWVASDQPTKDDDSVWALARQAYKGDIDKRANDIWKQSGGKGSGPTPAQIAQAESEFDDKVTTRASELWTAGSRNAAVAGSGQWVRGEQDILNPTAIQGFDAWATAGRPNTGKDDVWTPALAKWKSDKRPVDVDVDLRPPYRVNFGQEEHDGAKGWGDEQDGAGFSWTPSLSVGPVEGLRPHFDLELMAGAPYNQPTVTTVRGGVPSASGNGWGLGLRQQDTRMLARINFSFGTLDNNKAKVHDLTDPDSPWSGSEAMIYNGRMYLDIGNRNRARFDMNKGSNWLGKPASVYIRQRETAFAELGLGVDFLRLDYGDNEFVSFNGYYELQFYPFDYRNQITWKPGGGDKWLDHSRGFQQYPLFEIDPAWQLSWTEPPQVMDFSPNENADYGPVVQNEVG